MGGRKLCLPDDAIGWFLGRAMLRQMDAVVGLVDHELVMRETNRRNRLLCKAAFPAAKSIDDFDFADVKMPEGHDVADMMFPPVARVVPGLRLLQVDRPRQNSFGPRARDAVRWYGPRRYATSHAPSSC